MIRAPLMAAVLALYPTGAFREAVALWNPSASAEGGAAQTPLLATASPKGFEDGKADRLVVVPLVDMTLELPVEALDLVTGYPAAPFAPDLRDAPPVVLPGPVGLRVAQVTPWLPVGGFLGGGGGFVGGYLPETGGAIPEPGSWALIIMGAGAVGAALRRRRARA